MPNYDERIRKNRAFLNRAPTDRPLLGIWVGSYMPFRMYRKAVGERSFSDDSTIAPDEIDPKDFLEDIDRLFWEHEQIGDDLIWAAAPLIGFPWMEAIVGCPIYARSDSFWAAPCVNTWEEISEIEFSRNNEWFQKMLEFKEVLTDHSRGRYPIATSPSPMRGPGDIMGATLGQNRLCLEMYDNPNKVEELASIYTDIWIQVNKNQVQRTAKFHNGYLVAFYNIWSPDLCQYVQEDALDYLSPKLFRQVLLGNHLKIFNSFKSTLMHLHPNSLYCLDDFYNTDGPKMIEINRDMFGPPISELLPALKRTQEHKPLIIWGDLVWQEIRELLNALSPRGLCIYPVVGNLEEGKNLLERMKKQFP